MTKRVHFDLNIRAISHFRCMHPPWTIISRTVHSVAFLVALVNCERAFGLNAVSHKCIPTLTHGREDGTFLHMRELRVPLNRWKVFFLILTLLLISQRSGMGQPHLGFGFQNDMLVVYSAQHQHIASLPLICIQAPLHGGPYCRCPCLSRHHVPVH